MKFCTITVTVTVIVTVAVTVPITGAADIVHAYLLAAAPQQQVTAKCKYCFVPVFAPAVDLEIHLRGKAFAAPSNSINQLRASQIRALNSNKNNNDMI